MSGLSAIVEALVEAGATPNMILAAVRAHEGQADAAIAARRANDAERQARRRARKAGSVESHVTSRDVTVTDRDPSSSLGLSPEPPIQNPSPSCPSTPYSPPPSDQARRVKPTKAELDAIWDITPTVARQRSSRADLERSLAAAMRRGHEPAAVQAGLKAAYASETYAGDMAKGVHRLIEADRWQSFADVRTAEPDWPALVALWSSSGRWRASLGPPPDHAETRVPPAHRPTRAAA